MHAQYLIWAGACFKVFFYISIYLSSYLSVCLYLSIYLSIYLLFCCLVMCFYIAQTQAPPCFDLLCIRCFASVISLLPPKPSWIEHVSCQVEHNSWIDRSMLKHVFIRQVVHASEDFFCSITAKLLSYTPPLSDKSSHNISSPPEQ